MASPAAPVELPRVMRPACELNAGLTRLEKRLGKTLPIGDREDFRKRASETVNGDLFGLPLPKAPEDFAGEDYGPAWLTEAFRAAGTLAADNRVTSVQLLTAPRLGGSGPKAILNVEYEKADANLDTQLFVKLPCLVSHDLQQRIYCSSPPGDCFGGEINFYYFVSPHLPFSVPKLYFADLNRYNSDAVLILAAIQFPEGEDPAGVYPPFTILPTTNKCEDGRYKDVHEYYKCLMRKQGIMAGLGKLDKLGPDVDSIDWSWWGPAPSDYGKYGEPAPPPGPNFGKTPFEWVRHFIEVTTPQIWPEEVKSSAFLDKFVEQMNFIGTYSKYVHNWLYKDARFKALLNMNANSDNGYFWRDEAGALDAGLLDWASSGNIEYTHSFLSMLTSALGSMVLGHEDELLAAFFDGFSSTGAGESEASAFTLEELKFRFRVHAALCVQSLSQKVFEFLKPELKEHMQALRSYDDPRIASGEGFPGTSNECFNAAFGLSMAYNQIILWPQRGQIYFDAFAQFVEEIKA